MKSSRYILGTAIFGLFACSNPTEIETELSSTPNLSDGAQISSSITSTESSTDNGTSTDSKSETSLSSEDQIELSSNVVKSSANEGDMSSESEMSSSSALADPIVNTQECPYDATAKTLTCAEKTYKTTEINGRVWMAENMNYGTYKKNIANLLQTGFEKFCYDNDEANCDKLGGLYQWHTVMGMDKACFQQRCTDIDDSVTTYQGICPMGWHVPLFSEYSELVEFIGGVDIAGRELKVEDFDEPLNWTGGGEWAGTDNYGFAAIPGGRSDFNGGFYNNYHAHLLNTAAYGASVDYVRIYPTFEKVSVEGTSDSKSQGMSLRCIKD